ncbi:hypothetical protein LINPERHAP1_LOCUS28185 [Linum perenne]
METGGNLLETKSRGPVAERRR